MVSGIHSAIAAVVAISGAAGQQAQQNPSYFNPQLAIVGDFVGVLKDDSDEPRRFDFREIEFGFAADADPFLRVEAYISLAKEDGETITDVEEAFGRYSNLGKGLSGKVGKIAAAVGRVQRNHSDQLNYLDYPLVIRDVLGEEGFRQPGFSLSYLLPGDRFNEFTLEALETEDEMPVFNGNSFGNPAIVGRYRTFVDFSEDLSGQFGTSFLSGKSASIVDGATSTRTTLSAVDLVMKWHPGQSGKSASLEAEAFWTKPSGAETAFGYFVRGTYEVMPRIHVTAGYDYSEIPGTSDNHSATILGIALKPTEFHQWRLEYNSLRSNFESNRNMVSLQFQWVIGAHPAHKY